MDASVPRRYYQVVFIQMKDPPKFARYLELMAPVVRRYGGELERMLVPEAIHAEGVPRPDTINVVYYDSRDAFLAFNQDPDFQKIMHLRSESIDIRAVSGWPTAGQLVNDGLGDRRYVLEMTRLPTPHSAGDRSHEERTRRLQRFGYHVERVLTPDSAAGLPFEPDVVEIGYFDTPDALERWQRDPEHAQLEQQLHRAAEAASLRVIARVHPATLTPQAG